MTHAVALRETSGLSRIKRGYALGAGRNTAGVALDTAETLYYYLNTNDCVLYCHFH